MQLSLLATALLVIAPAALANPKPKKHCTLTEQPCASLANPYTATVYEHTVTETEAVDCGGCTAIAVSTRFCGLGLVSALLVSGVDCEKKSKIG
ncbi:MAG: hypothetical protein L6R39_005373 [Caloplaca ligustica]|nr:MAG: hypothetical protein L6R39_005373 [Caloplaca ligustica]